MIMADAPWTRLTRAGDPVRGVVVQQPPGQRGVAAARQDHRHVRSGRAASAAAS
jgi:hypothetical protein